MTAVRAALLLALLAVGCAPTGRLVMPASKGAAIATVKLGWSNVHAVFGEAPMIVDAGAQGELGELSVALAEVGAPLRSVRCAVITHGHADHAGTARAMQLAGIKIIAGAGDVARTRKGVHGPHNPTGVFARVLSWFLPDSYRPFVADVLVTDRYDLQPLCGVAGEVIATPGHTPGSVVILLAGGKIALVGDLLRGGLIRTKSPAVHFYQDDLPGAHAQIRALLARGVETFVLGHGGPIGRAKVAAKFGR